VGRGLTGKDRSMLRANRNEWENQVIRQKLRAERKRRGLPEHTESEFQYGLNDGVVPSLPTKRVTDPSDPANAPLPWRTRPRTYFSGYSQWDQDSYLYHNFFKWYRGVPGVFLDIGASHPTFLSNTAVFERCLDWRGYCVEPNPNLLHPILSYRECIVMPYCVRSSGSTLMMAGGRTGTAEALDTESASLHPNVDEPLLHPNVSDEILILRYIIFTL
jgi:hypothetical protein